MRSFESPWGPRAALAGWLASLLLGLALSTPAAAEEKWGPFRGQFVDAETGRPIAGVVVAVIWRKAIYTPVQTNQEFYDAREAVSDADGRFEVPRLTPPFFSFRILVPEIDYFAPGYRPVGERVTPPDGEPYVAPTVVQMRRLTTRQERLEQIRLPGGVPQEKIPRLIQARNEELRALGVREYR